MGIREHVPLSELTTFKVGGLARFCVEVTTERELQDAIAYAAKKGVPYRVIGQGSNLLASDAGYEGLIIRMQGGSIRMAQDPQVPEQFLLTATAGVAWDELVRYAAGEQLWGLENLAGIPGTVGAAPVQNIGAYGAEVSQTFHHASVLDTRTGSIGEMDAAACAFGYRESVFKHTPELIILEVSFTLSRTGMPRVAYADLARAGEAGADLSTPAAIGETVRSIRARKFPDLAVYGTAGSFFKNPVLSREQYDALVEKLGPIPTYPAAAGIKIPLAHILDKVLHLRGYQKGNVSLYQEQALVLVAQTGATATEVDTFANEIAQKVLEVSGITIEREVRSLQ